MLGCLNLEATEKFLSSTVTSMQGSPEHQHGQNKALEPITCTDTSHPGIRETSPDTPDGT